MLGKQLRKRSVPEEALGNGLVSLANSQVLWTQDTLQGALPTDLEIHLSADLGPEIVSCRRQVRHPVLGKHQLIIVAGNREIQNPAVVNLRQLPDLMGKVSFVQLAIWNDHHQASG
jgi:hypothetical protein